MSPCPSSLWGSMDRKHVGQEGGAEVVRKHINNLHFTCSAFLLVGRQDFNTSLLISCPLFLWVQWCSQLCPSLMAAVTAFEEGFSSCSRSVCDNTAFRQLGCCFSGKTWKVAHSTMLLSLSGQAVFQMSSTLGHTRSPGHLSSTSCALHVQESLVKPASVLLACIPL